ncbi:MAG TPA: hypothetical protein VFH68_20595 [Polyangia bacterium]|jgi:hypothetical protein|nr:hypothetical protein [Polyangia bacterium]
MFERRGQPILPRPAFMHRVARSVSVATALLAVSLGLGVVGYHALAGLDWIDALLDASMILTGMGPVSPLHGVGAKLFASAYALFSGVVFIASTGLIVAPLAHRFLHQFNVELEDDPSSPADESPGRRPRAKPSQPKT